jgi:excisionase family DNA binding protein
VRYPINTICCVKPSDFGVARGKGARDAVHARGRDGQIGGVNRRNGLPPMHSPSPPPEGSTVVRASARVATVAGLLDCHPSDIRRLVASGELRAHTKGTRGVRVFLDSVAAYQERQTRSPRGTQKALADGPFRKATAPTAAFRAAMASLQAKGLV